MAKEDKTEWLNLKIEGAAREDMEWVIDETPAKATTLTEVIQNALAVYVNLWKHVQMGRKVIIRDGDKEHELVLR